jgi:hypothetical protein
MAQLIAMLQNSSTFQTLAGEKQDVFLRLADEFDTNDFALHLSPIELTAKLQIGNKDLWQQFLQMDTVQSYIKSQMAFNSQIASRKAFTALQKEAMLGDTTAAKQINELAGIFNQQDNSKVIVLHQIQRPKIKPRPQEEAADV